MAGKSGKSSNSGRGSSKGKSARSAKSGEFVTLAYAKSHPATTVVETRKK